MINQGAFQIQFCHTDMAKVVKGLVVNICNIVVSIVISKIVYHEPVTVTHISNITKN